MSVNNGKPCKNCGGQDWNNDGKCRKCKSEHDKNYRQKNLDTIRAKKKQYCEQNPEKVRAGHLRWLENNYDKKKAYDNQYRITHKDKVYANHANWRAKEENRTKVNLASRLWRLSNPEKTSACSKRWLLENHDASIAKTQKRRAIQRGASGKYTAKEWQELLINFGNKCLCCGRSDVVLTVDHVVPLSKGGSNSIENIQPLCLSCNDKKLTKTIDYRVTVMEL